MLPSAFFRAFLLSFLALTASAADRPNVVLIMADDVGVEAFGAYGSKQYSTPRLDRIADSGVRFTHAYSTPLCTPSRVAIMTGKSNVRNYTDFGALQPGSYTFAQLFRDAGYKTAVAGKWQLQGSANVPGTPTTESGFDTYCLWNTGRTKRPRYWTPSIEQDGKLLDLSPDAYGPDVFTDFLIRFMEQNREGPFLAYYPMALVHDPFLPTPDSTDRDSRNQQRNFEDMVAYADKIVARIDDALSRLEIADETILIFTSDNGTHRNIRSTAEHRMIQGAKGTTRDAGNHVPLIVRAPGARGGRVLDDLIDFSDFLPTLAEAVGVKLPAAVQTDGVSFWPRILGQPGAPRPWHFTYYYPRPYTRRFDSAYNHTEVRFVRDQRFKLYGDGRFYDVSVDPGEKRAIPYNQGGAVAEAARKKLRGALERFPEHGEALPRRTWDR